MPCGRSPPLGGGALQFAESSCSTLTSTTNSYKTTTASTTTVYATETINTLTTPKTNVSTNTSFYPSSSNKPVCSSVNTNYLTPCYSGKNAENNKVVEQKKSPKNNHKRLRSSPEMQQQNKPKQSVLDKYWLGSPSGSSSNRYATLAMDEEEEPNSREMQKEPRISKPPPIYVSGVSNIQPLRKLLSEIAGDEYMLKTLNREEIKIQANADSTYSKITKALIEKNTQFHTYKVKSERNFNVVLKGLHYSTPNEEIREEIELHGHKVINVCNIKQRTSNKPLPMFWVNIKSENNNKDIYNISTLLHTKIVFEPPKKKRVIPQCTRCQRYGHTKKFCNHTPRCVKCAESHITSECSRKTKSENVKCVLCGENHPANYKGCVIYKELQQKQYPQLREKTTRTLHAQQQQSNANGAPSYAEVARNTNHIEVNGENREPSINQSQVNNLDSNTTDMKELKTMLKTLLEQIGTILNLLTAVLANQQK